MLALGLSVSLVLSGHLSALFIVNLSEHGELPLAHVPPSYHMLCHNLVSRNSALFGQAVVVQVTQLLR